jgi:3-phosphoglycerate kinase
VACSYGPKTGVENPEYSLEFFLDYLKSTTDPSIIFVKAKELNELPERIENESYPEGSTLLLENINFLPAEALTTQNGGVVSRLLMDEISSGVHLFELCTDVIVNDNKD